MESAADKAELSAVGHGVTRVDGDIEQGRFELHLIRQTGRALRLDLERDADVLAQRAPQQFNQRWEQLVQIHAARTQHLPARERQHLARQLGGAPAGPVDGLQELQTVLVMPCLQMLLHHLQVALDHGQQIIEVVCNAACELAYAFHLVRLTKLRLHLRTLQTRRQYAGHGLQKSDLIRTKVVKLDRTHGKHADHVALIEQRHTQSALQTILDEIQRHRKSVLAAPVRNHYHGALHNHKTGSRIGPNGHAVAFGASARGSVRTDHAQLKMIRLQQAQHGTLATHRQRGQRWRAQQQFLRVGEIDRLLAQRRQLFVVMGLSHRLLHAQRIGAAGGVIQSMGHSVRRFWGVQRHVDFLAQTQTSTDRNYGRKHIANTAHRLQNFRATGHRLELSSQTTHQHIHRPIKGCRLTPPRTLPPKVARQPPPRVTHKNMEKIELARRQVDISAAWRNQPTATHIQYPTQKTEPVNGLGCVVERSRHRHGATQHRLHTRQQLSQVKGFGDVVVSADFQPDDLIHGVAPTGDQDDAGLPVFTQASGD